MRKQAHCFHFVPEFLAIVIAPLLSQGVFKGGLKLAVVFDQTFDVDVRNTFVHKTPEQSAFGFP